MSNTTKTASILLLAFASIILGCTFSFSAMAQSASTPTNTPETASTQPVRNPTFRQSGDTLIFNASPIWGATMSSFWGYTPLNSAKFNAVMEENGYAPVGDWVYSVGLGRSYTWNNFYVGVYGYVGVTFNSAPANSRTRSTMLSFGIDEYFGYVVAQNETFRLYPHIGLHLNWRSFNASDRSNGIDVSALQLGAAPPQTFNGLTLTGLDIGASIGIGGDVRVPLPGFYKMEGAETVYRQDLIIGLQLGYMLDLFPGISSMWQMNGTRVNNLPSVSGQGFTARVTFTADVHSLIR